MRTKIELGTSGTIDLSDDVAYSLNFAIADIRTPDKRDANYSKTIKIPGSKSNNKLFAHIFYIDIDCNFDPNIKAPCILYIDELEQMRGYLQLLKIYVDDQNKIEYEVTIKGNIGNIFTAIGDDELRRLNLSEYNHIYNKTNQKASWTAPVGVGYVYPMLDVGYNTLGGSQYDVKHFIPCVYVKTYLDKIFEYAGYRYNSNFLNSDRFKRLIIPYNGGNLQFTDSYLSTEYVEYQQIGGGGTYTITIPPFGATVPESTPANYNFLISDANTQFSTVDFRLRPTGTGNWTLAFDIGEVRTSANIAKVDLFLMKYSGGTYSVLGSNTGNIVTTSVTSSIGVTVSSTSLSYGDEVLLGIQVERLTGAGAMNLIIGNSGNGGTMYSYLNSDTTMIDGNTIDMNSAIPDKFKMKDFLKNIIQMFNLYLETSKENASILNIEPRDDFYSSGTTIDWSSKLDMSQPLVLEPMGELEARSYLFNYTDDKDWFNALYKSDYNETYGQRTFNTDNEFLSKLKENKITFAPTPLWDGSATDRIISAIIPAELTATSPKATVPRILYYGGVKNTGFSWTYTGLVSGVSTETTYPYAGHLDDPDNPTFDLSFGVPREIYYDTIVYTNNNLVNAYHINFLREITDKDSKIVTGWFYLRPSDIYTLDFRNQFYVNGSLLRLNKIFDYNPVTAQLTKCEFIKIKSAKAFVPEQKTAYGGSGTYFTNERV